jgi:glycosyltransferase involved in cell wall biosynthesis
VLQYIPCLEREGYLPEVFVIPKNYMDRLSLFRIIRDFDLVFLHRKLLSAIWWLLLRKNSRNLIYDFDDAVMFRDSAHKDPFSARKMNSFKRIIRNADIVIAGNEYLKNLAVNENSKTFVVPTPIDMNRYTEKPPAIGSNPLILGWIGSSVTLFYLENMKNVLDTIFDRFPFVRLKIIADKFFDCDRMPVIKKQWAYEEEISDLHSFDIGLMPLTRDPWSMGKCGFKLLQYMAVGVPAVCSPVGVNKEIVIDGENGFWADNELEWIDKVGELVKNRQLRIEMGIRARRTVIERYSTVVNGKKIMDLFSILNNTGQRKKTVYGK